MDNGVTLSISPVQALLSLIFQVWIIVFPIIIIKKLNYMTDLLQSSLEEEQES